MREGNDELNCQRKKRKASTKQPVSSKPAHFLDILLAAARSK
jgi:hypothetical protein